jgi:hypothetical protein
VAAFESDPSPDPYFTWKSVRELEPLGLIILSRMSGAVLQDGVDSFPGDVANGLAEKHERTVGRFLRTPPREGIMPNRDMSSFVPARL